MSRCCPPSPARGRTACSGLGHQGLARGRAGLRDGGEKRLVIEEGGNAKPAKRRFGNRDQFAPLLLEFSDAIKKDRDPFPNGAEGIADIRVIEAIYRSVEQCKPVTVDRGGSETGDALVHRQGMKVPPHPKPELIRAEGPSS